MTEITEWNKSLISFLHVISYLKAVRYTRSLQVIELIPWDETKMSHFISDPLDVENFRDMLEKYGKLIDRYEVKYFVE